MIVKWVKRSVCYSLSRYRACHISASLYNSFSCRLRIPNSFTFSKDFPGEAIHVGIGPWDVSELFRSPRLGAGIQGTKRRLGRGREVRVPASSFPSKKLWARLLAVLPSVRLRTVGNVGREGALPVAEFKIPGGLSESRLRFGSRRDC